MADGANLHPADDPDLFQDVLRDVIELQDNTINRMDTQLINTARRFSQMEVANIFQHYVKAERPGPFHLQRLVAFKFWYDQLKDLQGNHDIDISEFNNHKLNQTMDLLGGKTDKTSDKKESPSSKEFSKKFNGKSNEWDSSKKELEAYLNTRKNTQGIPLYYVIRDPNKEQQYRINHGRLGALIYDAQFTGEQYETDDYEILSILKAWTAGGLGHSYVETAPNAQVAWEALKTAYESIDSITREISDAREGLRSLHWSRNTPNFTFEDYCSRVIRHNNTLDRHSTNVDFKSQVDTFMLGALKRNPDYHIMKHLN